MEHLDQHAVDVMSDERVMRIAIHAAIEATRRGDMPFGACLVNQTGSIVSIGRNSVATTGDPTAHAEIQAIRQAARLLQSPKLHDCILYSTCEPCPMCFSACHWAQLRRIVYGACMEDGKPMSAAGIPISCWRMQQLSLSEVDIVGGVLRDDCRQLFATSSVLKGVTHKAPKDKV